MKADPAPGVVLTRGTSRKVMIAAVIVVLVVAAVVYSSSTFLAPSPPSGPSPTVSLTTTGGERQTLVIDDAYWPMGELNLLLAPGGIPWPNWLAYTVYQPLITVNGTAEYEEGVVQFLPALASDWTVSSDGKIYTINLRKDVSFSNGDPLNAYQVWAEMYGWYYLSANSSAWLWGLNLFDMSTVEFGPGTIELLTKSGVINPSPAMLSVMMDSSWPIYVTGPYQIVFHLKVPFLWLPGIIVLYQGLIYDTQWVLENGGWGSPGSLNTYFNLHPIPGTGPYVVTEVGPTSYLKFSQNLNYWGRNLSPAEIKGNPYLDPGHVKDVIVNYRADDVVRYVELSSGTAQIAAIFEKNWRSILSNPDKFAYWSAPSWSAMFVGMSMNTQRYPTNIVAVRQAIVHAINYTDISEKVFFGGLMPFVGPEFPLWSEFYDLGDFPPYNYDPMLAKQYLAEANVKDMPTLTFRLLAGCTFCIDAAQIVQSNLADIGITVTIEVVPPSQFALPYYAGVAPYSAALKDAETVSHLMWFGAGPYAGGTVTPVEPWVTTVSYNSTAGNYAIYGHPNVQPCVEAWTSTADVALIKSLCTKAQAQIYNDAPYIYLGLAKPFLGGGSLAWDRAVVHGFLTDPVYGGQSSTAIFNTVTFVGASESFTTGSYSAQIFASEGTSRTRTVDFGSSEYSIVRYLYEN